MMRNISIEKKMIAGAFLFVFLLIGYGRYEFSQNLTEQFLESKKSKNELLINTISPIIGLNISLGLNDANNEYLNQIVQQNSDLVRFLLIDSTKKELFKYTKGVLQEIPERIRGAYYASRLIHDPVTGETIGRVTLVFDDHEYQALIQKNHEIEIRIFGMTLVILLLFVLYLKKEFKYLKRLSNHVMQYDPKSNNFNLPELKRNDEVGIIHNAIVQMVEKIRNYTILLDEMNQTLTQKVAERTKELQETNEQLQKLSTTDPLTQLPNRRHLEYYLKDIWELAERKQVKVSMIMCDIDHFKQINDTYGHLVGDFVLKDIANVLKRSLKRSTDFVARYGGEEFTIVLYDTDTHDAEYVCEAIQSTLRESNPFQYQNVTLEPVTLSFGISTAIPDITSHYQDLFELSDKALYQAKESGRNQFVSVGNH